eukprot:SAG31_NODE_977_length_10615_cov_93.546786_3_plen_126_part_00
MSHRLPDRTYRCGIFVVCVLKAIINCIFAVGIGSLVVVVPRFVPPEEADHMTALLAVSAGAIFSIILWWHLRRVSDVLAAFTLYTFLSMAITPSASVMFYWYHGSFTSSDILHHPIARMVKSLPD